MAVKGIGQVKAGGDITLAEFLVAAAAELKERLDSEQPDT